jgi:hypothetical protein
MRKPMILASILFVSAFFILLIPVRGDFAISEIVYNETLIAGGRITKNITFNSSDASASGIHIITTIAPDPVGINVTYSNLPSPLLPHTEYTIYMHINTSFLLAPDRYIITSSIYGNDAQSDLPPTTAASFVKKHHTFSYPAYPQVIYYPTPKRNETAPPTPPPPSITPSTTFPFSTVWLACSFIIIALLILLYAYRKRKKT